MYSSLINAETVLKYLNDESYIIIDCRYDLQDKSAGKSDYVDSHIAGALYADLAKDLSGPPITNKGRHPLLTEEAHLLLFNHLGISSSHQVVVYDAQGGAFAARLWWMLHYLGHQSVAVLDGGWQAWQELAGPVESGMKQHSLSEFDGSLNSKSVISIDEINKALCLIDSREPARYRGEIEPIDPVAGHIPGAMNRFFKNNLRENGQFKDSNTLREEFTDLISETPINEVVFYCGSGVTACHNILACYHAFDVMPRLYAGSWSEWSSDPDKPVETSFQ